MKTIAKSIATLLLLSFAVVSLDSCKKDKTEAPERIEINTYDDLDYFQNSIVRIDSLNNFVYRAYGVPLYGDDTTHLYIGVENLEEARDIFMNWIAPDVVVEESSGNLTCPLTDEDGISQGTVFFRPVELNGHVAEVSVSNGTRLYHFSQLTFLYNNVWPPVSSAQSRWHKCDIIYNVKAANVQNYFHAADQNLNWVCIRESGNGIPPMFCTLTNSSYCCAQPEYGLYEEWDKFDHLQKSRYCPALGTAQGIGRILQADWDLFNAVFEEANGNPIGDRPYWYDGSHWAWFKVYCELIFYKSNYTYGECHASAPFLLKIDWVGDDDIYDGASIGY